MDLNPHQGPHPSVLLSVFCTASPTLLINCNPKGRPPSVPLELLTGDLSDADIGSWRCRRLCSFCLPGRDFYRGIPKIRCVTPQHVQRNHVFFLSSTPSSAKVSPF